MSGKNKNISIVIYFFQLSNYELNQTSKNFSSMSIVNFISLQLQYLISPLKKIRTLFEWSSRKISIAVTNVLKLLTIRKNIQLFYFVHNVTGKKNDIHLIFVFRHISISEKSLDQQKMKKYFPYFLKKLIIWRMK